MFFAKQQQRQKRKQKLLLIIFNLYFQQSQKFTHKRQCMHFFKNLTTKQNLILLIQMYYLDTSLIYLLFIQ